MTTRNNGVWGRRGGFITDPLPDFPGDWECLIDFCGTMGGDGPWCGEKWNYAAWWSPSKGVVHFLGDWADCPVKRVDWKKDSGDNDVREQRCREWAYKHSKKEQECAKDYAEWKAQRLAHEKELEVIEADRKANGVPFAILVVDGPHFHKEVSQFVPWAMDDKSFEETITNFLKGSCPEGTTVTSKQLVKKPYEEWIAFRDKLWGKK